MGAANSLHITWSVNPARMHDGEVDVSVCLCQLLCHHHLLPLERTYTDHQNITHTKLFSMKSHETGFHFPMVDFGPSVALFFISANKSFNAHLSRI